jgi:hypothetical protein
MSLDDDLRRSLPSQQVMRSLSDSVLAMQKSVGFDVLRDAKKLGIGQIQKSAGFEMLRDAKKLGIGQIMSDAPWNSVRSVIHDATPRFDVSQIAGTTLGLEREQPGLSAEWMAAEAERRWAGVETRDAIYALHEEVEAARADAQAARDEARAAGRRHLRLTIAVLALGIPSTIVSVVALIALL